ncbi:hypothetical protein DPQ33_04630 [Oceanidesulfovibrio indonesiensis]|uniref:WD40 repeat domain-containing protein n=1 Tax=Oceanidesulfovibrio indonesiensis TaxID=54767 RepID=A0A7M3MHT8_9BACT|nr:hypothetical protein [Oceanidesulfovibrio indonesiensis]TVM18763.1 hypothetical protein DPQ33_04630 [Oceanidesulfovibrio indonesiensis]
MPDAPESLTIVPSRHIRKTTLHDVAVVERRADGRIKRAFVNSETVVSTSWGDLVPQFSGDSDGDSRRPRLAAVRLDSEGRLASLALERMQELDTPLGPLPAELVTFHEDGSLKRVFPLNGKLSAYWSWQNEYTLAPEIALPLPAAVRREECAHQTARFINIQLSPDGALRSATLWPGETLDINTPLGPARARVGVSFHENGRLASFEPDTPFCAATLIGEFHAYDPDPEAVSGDVNSLAFAPDGSVCRVTTVQDAIRVEKTDGSVRRFAPQNAGDLCRSSMDLDDPEGMPDAPGPLTVWFDEGKVCIAHGRVGASGALPEPQAVYGLQDAAFSVEPLRRGMALAPLQRSCG